MRKVLFRGFLSLVMVATTVATANAALPTGMSTMIQTDLPTYDGGTENSFTASYRMVTIDDNVYTYVTTSVDAEANSDDWSIQQIFYSENDGKKHQNYLQTYRGAGEFYGIGSLPSPLYTDLTTTVFLALSGQNWAETAKIAYDTTIANNADATDTTAPVLSSVDATIDGNELTLTFTPADATDACFYYIVDQANELKEVAMTNTHTIAGLAAETNYTLVITPIDFNGNAGATITKAVSTSTAKPTAPTTAAPGATSIHDDSNVVAIFSDQYTVVGNVNYRADWSQSIQSIVEIAGENVLKVEGLNWNGIDFDQVDLSEMQKMYVDVWTPDDATLDIYVKNGSADPRKTKSFAVTGGEWQSFDVLLSEFTGDADLATINQMVLDQGNNKNFFFDNLYFYKTSSTDLEDNELSVSIYPNPTVDVVNIAHTSQIAQIAIYDILGQHIFSRTVNARNTSIDLSNLSVGTYYATITTSEGKTMTQKLVKK